MKHISYLIFCLLFLLFFSCKNNDSNKKVTIGFSQCTSNDAWRKAMNKSMRLQADLTPSIVLKIYDGNGEVENQIEDIEKFIQEKVDILIVSPLQSKPITPIVEKAIREGIPVLIVDRKTEGQNYTAYLGADNYEVGTNAAKYISSLNKGVAKIIEIKGLEGSSPALERSLGFKDIIDNSSNLELLTTINSNWEASSIKESFGRALDEFSDVDYVFVHNDRMALGAWEVAKEKNLHKKIKFIGVDGLHGPNGGIQLVKDEILLATILYPTGGSESIKLALDIINKKPVPKRNKLNSVVIDFRNADIMKNQFDRINGQQLDIEEQQSVIKHQEETYLFQNNILKILVGLMVIILALAIYSIYSVINIKNQKRLLEQKNNKITIQRNQIEKIAKEVKYSNDAKFNFFTGLSHEFKTPITLILSSIESLSENEIIKKYRLNTEVELMYSNSIRLLRLINQLLDYRKIEDRKFILRASKTNLYSFSKKIMKDFDRIAQKRNIDFKLTTNNENIELLLDRNLMDKVYFNLLSNSFKFTPNNGKISIEVIDDFESNFVKIYFKDTGIGILNEEIKQLFKPFFQGSNNNKNSSGIGLHLSKEFILLHKGKIEAKSKHGAEFIITLYKGDAHINDDEIIKEDDIVDTAVINFIPDYGGDDFNVKKGEDDDERFSVLIVEDNPDLVSFLKGKLDLEYDIHISDGTDAIEKASELIPDIIICDVNLPDKDGFEISEILKKDLRTSHIPIIILTALNDKESYIKGLEAGVDLYLTKPFSMAILKQSLKSLLYNRDKLRYYYTNNIHKIEHQSSFGVSEQNFILKINSIIKNNIDNSNFSVEDLAEKLFISRVQLYRKIKAILDVSISDYIQNIRLEKAKTLLLESALSISEIAYSCGFSSPNYFSTSFKNKYGKSPKSYKER